MRQRNGVYHLSASDLVDHLGCNYLTQVEIGVASGMTRRPARWDPGLELLWERGAIHEREYLDHLESSGLELVRIPGTGVEEDQVAETVKALRAGVDVVAQGALVHGGWVGRPDVLRRVDGSSDLGGWCYEAFDTKLARETKAGTILQLTLYSELLSQVQGTVPEFMHVVPPRSGFRPQTYRVADYAAYYRLVKSSLARAVANSSAENLYPDPKPHCEICRWWSDCDSRRRQDDHLSLVAGISSLQIGELKRRGVTTVAGLAGTPVPISWNPDRGTVDAYRRVREQARVQVEGRTGRPVYELLDLEPGQGLSRLPEPSPGDVFLDLEGDPFAGEGGTEYLFGYLTLGDDGTPDYASTWALSREEERRAFEKFVDFVVARWRHHPSLHVYHYAPYEPSALKRLMGRYASREEQIDQMLRAGLFVDLYAVTRRAIRASVESYSIKSLEVFYKFERSADLRQASRALAAVQARLELGQPDEISADQRAIVQTYNRDDCISACQLRGWLEQLRTHLIETGMEVSRPGLGEGSPSEAVSEWQQRVTNLSARIAGDVPADSSERTNEQQARWILANSLDWHRREEKSEWWEYFRLRDLPAEELMDERSGIAGLEFIGAVGGTEKAPIHRYRFPAQDTDLRGGESLHGPGGDKLGKLEAISYEAQIADIKKRQDAADVHPPAAFAHDMVPSKTLAESLMRLGEQVASKGIAGSGGYQPARDLLLRVPPIAADQMLRQPGETSLKAALRIIRSVPAGILPIQGPPGSGKTYAGARMICELVSQGAVVGVTGPSHKVIRNLLDETFRAATERGVNLRCIQKVSSEHAEDDDQANLILTTDNAGVFDSLGSGCQIAAGTAWLWARPEAREAVDVLFVDEAGQMSLPNVLAVSQAANCVVLLGDPQQLDQPTKGTHPDGVGVSALDHILAGHQTIGDHQGLFLEETWRLHPEICAFTSELFYDGKLRSKAGLEHQRVVSVGPLSGSGLRYLPVDHQGNQNCSPEEADQITALVNQLMAAPASWIDSKQRERPVGIEDILIIAPYNAQVFELRHRLPSARIGTVDKFQGQEAPIVIYSMATSTPADAPHGMEFLYSSNRLNVATSRARCLCLLVGSPALFQPECRTPRQMQLANAFCRFEELSGTIECTRPSFRASS